MSSTLWNFPLTCLKIITELSRLKRIFSLMCRGVEEETKWKIISQRRIPVRGELIVPYYLIFTLY